MFTRSSALSSPHFAHVDWIRIEVLFDADASAESYAERDAGVLRLRLTLTLTCSRLSRTRPHSRRRKVSWFAA